MVDSGSWDELIGALSTPDSKARERAAKQFASAAPETVESLRVAEVLFESRLAKCRLALLRLARRCVSGEAGRVAVGMVRRLARDEEGDVRRLALASLAREHVSEAHFPVWHLEALEDPDEGVARTALISLCEYLKPAACTPDVADSMLHYVDRRDRNQSGRVGLLLARAGHAEPAERLLLWAVAEGSHFWHNAGRRPIERAETFAWLGQLTLLGDGEVRAALERGIVEDPYSYGKEAAYQALRRMDAERAWALFLEAEPATHPPSKVPKGFDAHAQRVKLMERWVPMLCSEREQEREDALAIVRWTQCAGALERVLAMSSVDVDVLEELRRHLEAKTKRG